MQGFHVDRTLPAGIVSSQYPQVIYQKVSGRNNRAMEETEHWRLRLLELQKAKGLNQAQMAPLLDMGASYYNRLTYEPGKKGRKNLGLKSIRAACRSFSLPADWFDLPLGSELPNATPQPGSDEVRYQITEIGSTPLSIQNGERVVVGSGAGWPFQLTSIKRMNALKSGLGEALYSEAIKDIDSLLDVAVARWEIRAANLSKQAS